MSESAIDTRQKAFTILLVEDNPGDILMMEEALNDAGFPYDLHIKRHGDEALDFLRQAASRQDDWPDLVIMDLNLPGKTGRQILAELQDQPELMTLPVAILSTSENERHICQEYPRLRGTFATKTSDFNQLTRIIMQFREFAAQVQKQTMPLPASLNRIIPGSDQGDNSIIPGD